MKKIILLSLFALAITNCESKDDDKIYAAQQCLNTATPATVDACVAKVQGLSSNQSYVIRCSADFIRQKISTSRIVNALEDLDNGTGDVTTTALSFFTFKDDISNPSNTGKVLVASAVENCSKTGSPILKDLALLSQMATLLTSIAGLTGSITDEGLDPAALEAWLAGQNSGTINALPAGDLEALGNVIIQAQPSYCGNGGQFEGTEVCTDLNQAVNSGDPLQIAKDLLNQLKN
ncbi:MAG: hypothetical protein K2Q26_16110 [Bdellovibrionales bacterium]|nr:hypothetical protein [Bdellovibrionales bacterium]